MSDTRTDRAATWSGAAIAAPSGWPCLDFVNTLEWRLSDRNEFLRDYEDVVRWSRQAGLLTSEEARLLLEQSAQQPEHAAGVYETAIALREALFAIFSAAIHGVTCPASDLMVFNAALARAMVPARIVPTGNGFQREWLDSKGELGWMLGPVTRSAADLLVASELTRLKECPGGPGRACGFIFLDETKNRSRRWCNGSTCGNRTRLYRHYTRVRSGAAHEDS